MQILIRAGQELGLKSRHHLFIRNQVQQLLQPIGKSITRLIVYLQDVNGQKDNGPDKTCTIECRVAGMEPIVVRTTAFSLEQAVNLSATRMRRLLAERY